MGQGAAVFVRFFLIYQTPAQLLGRSRENPIEEEYFCLAVLGGTVVKLSIKQTSQFVH